MKNFIKLFLLIVLALPSIVCAAGRIQNEDVKTLGEITGAGGSASQLINDSKIYVTANGINQQLSSAITSGLIGGSPTTGASYAVNGKVNVGITGWSAVGGSSTVSQSAVNLGGSGNTNSALFTASGSSDYLLAQAVALPTGLNNCMIDFYYQTTSAAYSANIYYGANLIATLALPAATSFTHANLPFICSSVASNYSVQWTGGAASSTLYVTSYYIGGNSNIGSVAQAQFVGSITYGANCSFTRTSATMGDFGTQASCATTVIGNVSAISGILPGVNITNPQAGTYLIVGNGGFWNGTLNSDRAFFSFYDGTNYFGEGEGIAGSANDAYGSFGTFSTSATYTSVPSSLYFKLQCKQNSAGTCSYYSNNNNAQISVFFYPSQSQQVVTPNTSAAYWSGYFDNAVAWSRASTSYGDYTCSGTSNLVQRTNNNFGTVTKAASNLPGITFTPPRVGSYFICMSVVIQPGVITTTNGAQMTDGTNILSTVSTYQSSTNNFSTIYMCGIETVSSLSPVTIKLQGKSLSGITYIDNSDHNSIEISILNISQNFPMPQIVNSVVTNYQNQTSIVSAASASASGLPNSCTSSPCTIFNQVGTGITSITRGGTGIYTANFATGIFNQTPNCTCSDATQSNHICTISIASSSAVTIEIWSPPSTPSDSAFTINCIGTKN